jgi:hypothetical protein
MKKSIFTDNMNERTNNTEKSTNCNVVDEINIPLNSKNKIIHINSSKKPNKRNAMGSKYRYPINM